MRAGGSPPRILTGSRGGFARGREGGPSASAFAPRAFSLGRPGLRMSAAVLLKNEI